jgi:hypothetical protein
MRAFAVLIALLSVPAFAADYSPWPAQEPGSLGAALVELAQQRDSCCKHCTKGQPCGNTCISAKAKCKQPPGCAC